MQNSYNGGLVKIPTHPAFQLLQERNIDGVCYNLIVKYINSKIANCDLFTLLNTIS